MFGVQGSRLLVDWSFFSHSESYYDAKQCGGEEPLPAGASGYVEMNSSAASFPAPTPTGHVVPQTQIMTKPIKNRVQVLSHTQHTLWQESLQTVDVLWLLALGAHAQ